MLAASVRLTVAVGTIGRAAALERQRVIGLADMVGCVDAVAQDVCFLNRSSSRKVAKSRTRLTQRMTAAKKTLLPTRQSDAVLVVLRESR